AEFDDLFRRHLRNVYTLLDRPVPDGLYVSNISTGAPATADTSPCAYFTPTLDGEETSYFEWLGAGALEVSDIAGVMHRTDGVPRLLTCVYFGFDQERFYVRLDAARRMTDLLADGYTFLLAFLRPEGIQLTLRHQAGRVAATLWHRQADDQAWVEGGSD